MRHVTALVVGAGHSGLAISRQLTLRGIDHLVLDRGRPGERWRRQSWDTLRLLTPNWANGMPGAPYDGVLPDGFMAHADFVAQIERYATTVRAPVQKETRVLRVTREMGRFRVDTDRGVFRAAAVIAATGASAIPHVPALAGVVPPQIAQLTPSAYKRPSDLPDGGVLVVGASASGVQLAREIQLSGRPVTLAVGSHVRLPRSYRARDIYFWLSASGILEEGLDDVEDVERARRVPAPQLAGSHKETDLNALQIMGVEIVGRLAAIRDGRALFSGGLSHLMAAADLKMHRTLDRIDAWIRQQDVDVAGAAPDRPRDIHTPKTPRLSLDLAGGEIRSILWATGFRPDFSWLDLPVFDQRGRLRHTGGVTPCPGLYALGLPLLRRRASHQVLGAAEDARAISVHLERHVDTLRAA